MRAPRALPGGRLDAHNAHLILPRALTWRASDDEPGLADRRGVLRLAARARLVGHPPPQGNRGRLLPRWSQPGLVRRRRVDLRLQHRFRTSRRPRGFRRAERRGARALRVAPVVPAFARLGVHPVLHALARLYDARVPRTALLPGVAVGSLADLARRIRHHEDGGRDLRRRCRVRDAVAGAPASDWW